jgi:hypothetical protein
MLAAEGASLLYSTPSDTAAETVFFDGQWVFGKKAKNLKLAAFLVACDFGFPCGPKRFEVALACAVQGRCFDTLENLVLSNWESDGDIDPALIQFFRSRLKSKLIAQDIESFLPPKKS